MAIEIYGRVQNATAALIRALNIYALAFVIAFTTGSLILNILLEPIIVESGALESGEFAARAESRFPNSPGNFSRFCDESTGASKHEEGSAFLLLGCDQGAEGAYRISRVELTRSFWPDGLLKEVELEPGHVWGKGELTFWQLESLRWHGPFSPILQTSASGHAGIAVVRHVHILGLHLLLMPAALIRLSFVVVFTALFLQLVFEDKAMTEPL